MGETEKHPFDPFVPDNATVLIVGSFPGKEQTNSEKKDNEWYYGSKRNQFWQILSAVYEIELKTTEEKKSLFSKKGIAITDILLEIKRTNTEERKALRANKETANTENLLKIENTKRSSLDSNLIIEKYNDEKIKVILQNTNFKSIFFTSKFVEKHFLKFFPEVTNAECLPSPSPRYARMSMSDKINYYKNKLPK